MTIVALMGCRSEQDYKEQVDADAYAIIQENWDPNYGTMVNYKISDTEPLPEDIQVDKSIPESGILTLPRAVAIATAYNRQYQTEKEILYGKALDLRLAVHEFDPQYFGGAAGGYTKDGGDESIGALGGLGFNQLLASGARITTDVTLAWTDILTGNMESGLTALMNTAITQPLLRGRDSRVVMENLTQAQRDTVYQIRSFNRFRQTLAVSVISQYYRVLQTWDQVGNAQNNYETLKSLRERAEKLADSGRLPRFELNEAKQDELKARDTFIEVQKEYTQVLDEFKLVLSLPPSAEFTLDESELQNLSIISRGRTDALTEPELTADKLDFLQEELELLNLVQLEEDEDTGRPQDLWPNEMASYLSGEAGFSETAVIQTALSLRLDLANQLDAIADAERKVFVAADALRAELNLAGNASLSSQGRSDSAAALGLELNLPLERMAEANEYRRSLIVLTQQKRAYDEAVDTVVVEVRQAYRDFIEAAQRYDVQIEGLALAQKRFKNTLLLLQYGRTNTRDVLDAQEDLFDAQNAAAEALVNHTIAMLNFYQDTGVLQIRPDGMWEL